ncbi:MAG: hypothetical protein IPJ17_10035 [Holophagales bacterium]|nr:MAG: hypothetical protein IPJ17_10035 [Holophagales bacterium]
MTRLASILLGTLLVAVGPAGASHDAAPTPAPIPRALAGGVYCRDGAGGAPLLLAFAGWTVEPAWAWNWAIQLTPLPTLHADPEATTAGVCVLRGPADASYRTKDLATAELAEWLLARTRGGAAGPIVAIAHSSGSFVAHHLFRQLRSRPGGRELLAHIRYFNLDGAIGTGDLELDADLVAALGEVHAVYAVDPRTGSESANADDMRALHARAPAKVRLHALDAADSGCAPGAKWCLHDVLVTRRPHDPTRFDLARDYGNLDSEHPVQDGYLH